MTINNNQTSMRNQSNKRKRRSQQMDETQFTKRGRYSNLYDQTQQQLNDHPYNGFTTPKHRHYYVNQTPFTPTQDGTVKQLFTEHPIISSTPKRNKPETIWRPWLLPNSSTTVKTTHRRRVSNAHNHQRCFKTTPHRAQPTQSQRNTHCQRTNQNHQSPTGFYDNYFYEKQKNNCQNINGQKSRTAVQVPTGFEHFKQPVKLMWPKSKTQDYMFYEGQRFLDAFPVQATFGFYDDTDSDSGTSSPNPLQTNFNLPTLVN